MSQATFQSAATNTGNAVTSLVITKSITAGHCLILGIELEDGSQTVSGIVDAAGNDGFGFPYNKWVLIDANTYRGTRLEVWACRKVISAPATVTINLTGAQKVAAALVEYSAVAGFGLFASAQAGTAQNPTGSANIKLEIAEVATANETMVSFYGAYDATTPAVMTALLGTSRANISGTPPIPSLLVLDQLVGDAIGDLDTQAQLNRTVAAGLATTTFQVITLLISTSFTLQTSPGFADLADSALAANQPAIGVNINKISENAAFGMVRTEFFSSGPHGNGDVISLPQSPIDGYAYGQDEVIYVWGLWDSLNRQSLWASGKDTLWYGGWSVDQATGKVTCDEWYRRSGNNLNPLDSTDGGLYVFTIAQRQRKNLTISAAPTYSDVADSTLFADAALTQSIAQGLNRNAKFAVVNSEVFYMGEFQNGQTVPAPVSLADGHVYSSGETKWFYSWRWTPTGSTYGQPPTSEGQLGPFKCSISSGGAVTITVEMINNGGSLVTESGWGRVQVVAFCSRAPSTFAGGAVGFQEIDPAVFNSGQPLKASTMRQISDNIREAVCVPEYFGPTVYSSGSTVPLPTSPIDGYVYSRSELLYLYEWADTTPATGSNVRLVAFSGQVNQLTGAVALQTWRVPPGSPVIPGDPTQPRMNVLTIAVRQAQGATGSTSAPNPPSDLPSNPADISQGPGFTVNGV